MLKIPVEKSRVTDTILPGVSQTLTADQLLLLSITPGAPVTLTLPTGAEVATGMRPSDTIDFMIRNFGGGAVTVAVPAGSGSISGTATVNGSLYRRYLLRLDSLGAAPSYTVFDMGARVGPGDTINFFDPAGVNWVGANPTNVTDAIIRIAAALGPIA